MAQLSAISPAQSERVIHDVIKVRSEVRGIVLQCPSPSIGIKVVGRKGGGGIIMHISP
jgi:hypothetical protein